MDEWEPYAYQKVKQAFASELEFLDKGIDAIERCVKILIKGTPLLNKPNLNANLKNSKPAIRRSVSQILLLSHASTFLRATRFLLLNAYASPSLACLRVTLESILNAHVCKQSNKQTTNWVNCEKIERKEFRYPREFPKSTTNKILETLHEHGAHPNYLSFATQVLYPRVIFNIENQPEDEFFTLRNIHLCLLISSRFLKYLINKKPDLKKEFPDTTNIYKDLNLKTREIGSRLKTNLRIHTKSK